MQVGCSGTDATAHIGPGVRQLIANLVLQVEVVNTGCSSAPVAAKIGCYISAVQCLHGAIAEDIFLARVECGAVLVGSDICRSLLVTVAANGQVAIVEHYIAASEDIVGITNDVAVLHVNLTTCVVGVLRTAEHTIVELNSRRIVLEGNSGSTFRHIFGICGLETCIAGNQRSVVCD